MKIRFLLPFLAVSVLAMVDGARAADDSVKWETNYEIALKTAETAKKPVLVNFTGSDWCGWCIKLDKETFSKPEFAKFAADKLVLLEVDFPNGKPQTDSVKKQNAELQQKFEVEGFPTLVLLNSSGKEIARNVGYLPGGPEGMKAWVDNAVAKD